MSSAYFGLLKKRTVAAAPRVSLSNQFISAAGSAALGATARYRINSTGIVEQKQGSAAYATLETWLLTGTNADYEVQLTEVSKTGGTVTGASASWLATTAAREVSFVTTGVGTTNQANIEIKIRDKTTLVVLTSCIVQLESEWV